MGPAAPQGRRIHLHMEKLRPKRFLCPGSRREQRRIRDPDQGCLASKSVCKPHVTAGISLEGQREASDSPGPAEGRDPSLDDGTPCAHPALRWPPLPSSWCHGANWSSQPVPGPHGEQGTQGTSPSSPGDSVVWPSPRVPRSGVPHPAPDRMSREPQGLVLRAGEGRGQSWTMAWAFTGLPGEDGTSPRSEQRSVTSP